MQSLGEKRVRNVVNSVINGMSLMVMEVIEAIESLLKEMLSFGLTPNQLKANFASILEFESN